MSPDSLPPIPLALSSIVRHAGDPVMLLLPTATGDSAGVRPSLTSLYKRMSPKGCTGHVLLWRLQWVPTACRWSSRPRGSDRPVLACSSTPALQQCSPSQIVLLYLEYLPTSKPLLCFSICLEFPSFYLGRLINYAFFRAHIRCPHLHEDFHVSLLGLL